MTDADREMRTCADCGVISRGGGLLPGMPTSRVGFYALVGVRLCNPCWLLRSREPGWDGHSVTGEVER